MPGIPSNMAMFHAFEEALKKKEAERKAMFDRLRAARNKAREDQLRFITDLVGSDVHVHVSPCFHDDDCYCNCGEQAVQDGVKERLCEHDWSGPTVELYDGQCISATCKRCGMPAISHDMRNAP